MAHLQRGAQRFVSSRGIFSGIKRNPSCTNVSNSSRLILLFQAPFHYADHFIIGNLFKGIVIRADRAKERFESSRTTTSSASPFKNSTTSCGAIGAATIISPGNSFRSERMAARMVRPVAIPSSTTMASLPERGYPDHRTFLGVARLPFAHALSLS